METAFREVLKLVNKEALVEFLKNIPFEKRKKLMSVVRETGEQGYRIVPEELPYEARMKYHEQFYFAEIVCATQKQLTKIPQESFRQEVKENDFISWFEPGWFNDYINSRQFLGTMYQKSNWYMAMIPWVEKGYIDPNPELVSTVLWTEERTDYPEITFSEHIWYLFEYPQRYCWADDKWIKKFEQFIAEGRIDRIQTLKEIILTATRTFPKQQAEWFMNLLDHLKPTNQEAIELQAELLAGLSNQFSKVVKTLLTYIQPVCTDKNFNIDNLVNYLPVVFSSPTKANVTLGLKISTAILEKRAEYNSAVLAAQSQVFLSKDESLQKKAAELYVKFGDRSNTQIREALTEVEDHIFASVKDLLSPFLGQQSTERNTDNQMLEVVCGSGTEAITLPQTTEDFIFWLYEFFEHPQINQYEQFYQLLIRFSAEMIQYTDRLEPSVKLVGKKIGAWQQNNSIAFATADFYFRYLICLTEHYPGETNNLKKVIEENIPTKGFFEYGYKENNFVRILKEQWYEKLLKVVIDNVHSTILSVPTHQPVWIDPVVFIERLMWYEQTSREPNDIDMQLAIQRIHLVKTQEVLTAATGLVTPEYQALINYLFRNTSPDKKQIKHKAWWHTAALTRSDRPDTSIFEEKENLLFTLPKAVAHMFKQNRYFLLNEYLSYGYINDFLWLLGFCPNNTDAVTLQIIKVLENGDLDEAESVKILEFVTSLNRIFSPSEEKMLANSMWIKYKTVRIYAAGCWLEKINRQQLDPVNLGKQLGYVSHNNPTSLKRFTDLVYDQMLNGNPYQKQALEISIKYMLSEIKEPITNLKTLLEIYNELLITNQSVVDGMLLSKLEDWQQNKTLSKAVFEILKRRV